MEQRGTILFLRIVAGVIITVAAGTLLGALRSIPNLTGTAILPPLAIFVIDGGVGVILLGISAIIEQRQTGPAEVFRTLSQVRQQLADLATKVDDLGLSVDRLGRAREPMGTTPIADDVAPPQDDVPEVLAALEKLFQELRDLSLLTDDQRRQRSQELLQQQKKAAIQSIAALIRAGQWSEAEKALVEMESQRSGDSSVTSLRSQLALARVGAESEAIATAESEIESEMSLSHWDHALNLARQLSANFPTSARATRLFNRVQREHGIYTETTVQHLYEEIRRDVERRVWRRALQHAQDLLQAFPDHTRSELIRKQVGTIQENAEIEERQEEEVRIGELIRARRFREAIQLSEDLLNRFPNSPQAEAIEKMLPRIRQLADEADKKSSPSSTAL